MKTTEEHRLKVREIADLAFANAVDSMDVDKLIESSPKDWEDKVQEKFITLVHEGFRKAQDLLIEEILYYQKLVRKKQEDLKEYRKKRDSENQENTKIEISVINQRLSTFSHIADGIAWQLIGGEIHIARRFHIGEKGTKFLASSNIEHAKKVVEEINQNPLDFALISDLTSYVQIGDVLIKHKGMVGVMELKEGKVNQQIKDFITELEEQNKQVTEQELSERFDRKTVRQAQRMLRQMDRASKATEIMNNDKGIDPISGQNIIVSTPTIATEGYHEEFHKLIKELESKVWGYTVIESCLHVGMYRDEGRIMAGPIMEKILEKETPNHILIDWLTITDNLSQPIFAKPFKPDFIVDVLTGKIKIILGLNLDRLIELFNDLGLKTKWLSTKRTAKIKQQSSRKDMVVINNRGITMNVPHLKESEMILSGGIISKILYDNIKPSNIAMTLLTLNSAEEE